MELEHNFTVAAPVEQAWEVLLDLERIAPCMPGATLTSVDGDEFTGNVRVRLGPVTMTFAGQGRFVERDAAARRIVVEASGKDKRGGGTARATVTAGLTADGENSTAVAVRSDLVVTGRVAQFGRGMIADVSTKLLGRFTDCLATKLAAPSPVAAAAPSPEVSAAPQVSTPEVGTPSVGTPSVGTPEVPAPETGAPTVRTPEVTGTPATANAVAAASSSAASPPEDRERPPAPAAPAEPAEPAEPIDLLGVTGVRSAAGRLVPYLVVFIVGAVVGALVALLVT